MRPRREPARVLVFEQGSQLHSGARSVGGREREGKPREAQSRPLGSQIRQSSAGKAPELNGVPQIQSTRAVMRRPPLARPAPQLVIVVIIFSFLLRSAKGYRRRSKPARIIFTSRAPAEGGCAMHQIQWPQLQARAR